MVSFGKPRSSATASSELKLNISRLHRQQHRAQYMNLNLPTSLGEEASPNQQQQRSSPLHSARTPRTPKSPRQTPREERNTPRLKEEITKDDDAGFAEEVDECEGDTPENKSVEVRRLLETSASATAAGSSAFLQLCTLIQSLVHVPIGQPPVTIVNMDDQEILYAGAGAAPTSREGTISSQMVPTTGDRVAASIGRFPNASTASDPQNTSFDDDDL